MLLVLFLVFCITSCHAEIYAKIKKRAQYILLSLCIKHQYIAEGLYHTVMLW